MQALTPLRGRCGFGEHALLAREQAQQFQQGIQRGQRAAFQFAPRRNALDRVLAAAGMAEQQAIQRELPGVGIVVRCAAACAMRGIQPPARAGALQPAAQAFDVVGVEATGLGQRRAGEQVQGFLQPEARDRQCQQAQEHLGQRFAGERTGIGDRVRDGVALAVAAEGIPSKDGIEIRQVGIDVRRQHRDLARLQRRVEARVFQQPAQAVVQHLQFAQAGVAGVELQAGIVGVDLGAPVAGRFRAAMEQVRLQPMQQAVAQRAVGSFGIDIRGDLAGGMHDFVATEQGHEVLAGRAPVAQQRVLVRGSGERIDACAQARAERLQVAPVFRARRRQIEVQRADARLRRQHAQHVRRDIERAEREQARRQTGRQRIALGETRQVLLDAARAMAAAGDHRAPQDGLRVIGVRAVLPTQQPVAAPGLVFLEHRGQFAGQRPRLDRIVAGQRGLQRAQCGPRQQHRIGQRGVQPPLQAGGIEVVLRGAEVRRQRPRHELAGSQEVQVGGDAVPPRQRGLQPAPHRHLRDQHDVRRQRRLPGHRLAQFIGQQFGQHLQRVGVVEAEVGRGGHESPHCAGGGRAGCDRPALAANATPERFSGACLRRSHTRRCGV